MKTLLRFVTLCLVALVAFSFALGVSDVHDEANICKGNECYPRVFVPSEEFQVVKEGQEIPKGFTTQSQF
jgi:nucleotide exchange factor SIL1